MNLINIKRLLLLMLAVAPALVVGQQRGTSNNDQLVHDNGSKFMQLLYFLDKAYLDPIAPDSLTESAIVAMLEKLDPHSAYITKEEFTAVNDSFDGNFEGIGIEFNVLHDTILVVNTISGGPSERVGLKPNDRIVKVDGESVVGVKTTDVPKILRGPKGTKITASVVRRGEVDTLDFVIERDKIPMYSLDAAYMIAPTTAYVKLNRFMSTTTDEMVEALKKLPDATSLILDLRGNGGGFLDQAISISSNLLPSNRLITYTEGRAVPRSDAHSEKGGVFTSGPLVVIVDEESASASEIVSGAVQDWDRGLVVGRPTFGKGLVQRQIPLFDSTAVRITVARYHTPSGRVIQRPYEKGNKEDYYLSYYNRYSSGELFNADSLAKYAPKGTTFKTLIKGREVHGGGGIMPDVFVPIDTTGYSKFWGQLIRKSIFTDFIIQYVEKNRGQLTRKYRDFDSYNANFVVTDEILSELYDMAKEKGVEPEDEEPENIEETLAINIKGLIAQKLWDTSEYFQVVNSHNDLVKKAVEVIEQWDDYAVDIK